MAENLVILVALATFANLPLSEARGVAILGHGKSWQTRVIDTSKEGDDAIPWWGWLLIVFTVLGLLLIIGTCDSWRKLSEILYRKSKSFIVLKIKPLTCACD